MMCQRIGLPPISTIGFGRSLGLLAEARAEPSGEDDCFHGARTLANVRDRDFRPARPLTTVDNAGPSPLLTPVAAAARPVRRPSAVLGVPLALTDYERTLDWIDAAVAARHRGYICVAAVHTVMACQEDPELRAAVAGADFTVPDGQPLVWALRALGHPLEDRVYGPELMDRACARAAQTGQRFYLYGGRNQGALAELARMLRLRHPGLKIVGGYARRSAR